MLFLLLVFLSSSDAVTLTGSSEYAVPGSEFTLRCDVPEEASQCMLYRRPGVNVIQGSIFIDDGQCHNTITTPVLCSPAICSCTTTTTGYGTVFQWVIQPKTGDHGSVWYCRPINLLLPVDVGASPDFTLNVAGGPRTVTLSPPDITYTRTEGNTLPDITCTADCIPGCAFVWTKPDNTNFIASAVLSLGQLDRSEQGTYRCTVGNIYGSSTISAVVTVQLCGDTSSFYRQLFVTSIVLTCVSVIILLINLGIGVFVTRFGHLPFMKRRMNRPNTSPQPFSSIEESGNAMAGIASGQERSMYTELDTTDFAAQNVYDQARPAHDIVLDGRAERSNYETLGEVSGPNVYEELKERRGSS